MTAKHRQALTAAGLFVALAAGAEVAGAQYRGPQPDPSTPRILVSTFRGGDRALGVQAADAVRDRVSSEFPVKQLFPISKTDVEANLRSSGYPPDSALSPSDLKELARLVRADEIIDGAVSRPAGGGVRVDARLLLSRDVGLAQPLGVVEAKNVGDAAKQIANELKEARKQLAANRECEGAARAGEWDKAVAAAMKGIAAYPKATLARLCLVTALSSKRAPPDEVIKAADEVLALDRGSSYALRLKYGALNEKGDKDAAAETLVALLATDPHNQQLQQDVAAALAASNPNRAIPILDTLIAQNPGDPALTRQLWLTLLRANEYKRALATGQQLARIDTTAADSSYFFRMIAAAASDSQPQLAVQLAEQAAQKFPRNASFAQLQSQLLRRAGQIPQSVAAMQRAVAIDPKIEGGYLTIVVGLAEQGQADSAIAWARQARAAGVPDSLVGNALLAIASPAIKRAQETKTRADWQAALAIAAKVDSVAPTKNSAYFVGVSAFSVAADALQGLNTTRSCPDLTLAEEMMNIASPAIMKGGSVDPASAGQIMQTIQQVQPQMPQYKQAICRGGATRRPGATTRSG